MKQTHHSVTVPIVLSGAALLFQAFSLTLLIPQMRWLLLSDSVYLLYNRIAYVLSVLLPLHYIAETVFFGMLLWYALRQRTERTAPPASLFLLACVNFCARAAEVGVSAWSANSLNVLPLSVPLLLWDMFMAAAVLLSRKKSAKAGIIPAAAAAIFGLLHALPVIIHPLRNLPALAFPVAAAALLMLLCTVPDPAQNPQAGHVDLTKR